MQGIYKTNSYMASYTYLHSYVAMYIIYYKIAAYVAICKLISLSLYHSLNQWFYYWIKCIPLEHIDNFNYFVTLTRNFLAKIWHNFSVFLHDIVPIFLAEQQGTKF